MADMARRRVTRGEIAPAGVFYALRGGMLLKGQCHEMVVVVRLTGSLALNYGSQTLFSV
jgi:hypothetical protein